MKPLFIRPWNCLTKEKNTNPRGGDGLAARELLKYDDVEEITIVDLDPGVTELARTNNLIVGLNKDSLNNEKVKVINGDAFQF